MNRQQMTMTFRTKLRVLAMLALFSSFLSHDCWANKNEVQVLTFSEVPADQPIRLGQFTSPVGNSLERYEQLADLEIFDPRSPGDRLFLSGGEVARFLQEKGGLDELTFRIPNQIILEPKKNFIARGDLERALLKEIKGQFADCRIDIREIKAPDLSKVQAAIKSWSIDASNSKVQGNFVLPLKVETDKGSQNYFITGTVDIFREALVARRTIAMNEKISEQDFDKKLININFIRGSLLKESEVIGQVAAHYLAAAQPLLSGDLKREVATTKGQLVRVLAGDESLEIVTQGIAEESGLVGDLIKIKNSETQKLMSGKIVDKGVVKLQ